MALVTVTLDVDNRDKVIAAKTCLDGDFSVASTSSPDSILDVSQSSQSDGVKEQKEDKETSSIQKDGHRIGATTHGNTMMQTIFQQKKDKPKHQKFKTSTTSSSQHAT